MMGPKPNKLKEEIKGLLLSIKREGMKELVDYLEKETDYFTAPASTRFHEARKGGLMNHCWNVYTLLNNKNKSFNLKLRQETIIITAFLHDLCKVNVYKEKKLKNGEASSIPYELEENLPLGHCTKSIFLINKFMRLTDDEALMIRWHMSWSDYEFKKHIEKVKEFTPAVMALITSDIEASEFLDEKFENERN